MVKVVRAEWVFPVASEAIHDGAVVVERERVLGVGTAADMRARYPGAAKVDLGGSAVFPAAVNAHTHLELTRLAGAVPSQPFVDWILALIAARRALSYGDLAEAAQDGVRMLRESGTAAVGEISSAGASVAPVVESGLRGVVYFELLGSDPARAPDLFERGKQQIAEWRERYPDARVRFGLSLHTPYTVSAALFRLAGAWCADEGVPLCVHVAESPAETRWLGDHTGPIADTMYAKLGLPTDLEPAPARSPVAFLHAMGVLRSRPLLAHGVQVDTSDLHTLSDEQTPVVHCPRSNAYLHCGRMPYGAYRAAGVPLALGTDSLASSHSLSVWDELAVAWSLHRSGGDTVQPRDLLRLVTLDGAVALGCDDELGSLEAGKRAEMASCSLSGLSVAERHNAGAVLLALAQGRLVLGRARY